jgi:HEAT repeat protein
LLRLLGAVAPADRGALIAALSAQPRAEVSRALRAWRPGLDPALGCGTALAAAALGGQDMASVARNLLRAAEPDVRCAAVEALGALAQGSLLTAVARVLEDPDARVRAAAARAVGEACARTGDLALGENWLRRLAHDADERVRRARVAALERLGG